MRNNNDNSNPTCKGIELEELHNRLINFYDDNYFEYRSDEKIDKKMQEIEKSLLEALALIELQIKNNSQVKLDNWIRNSGNQ
jgi:hypothetical protein